MRIATYRNFFLIGLVLLIVLAFGWLVVPKDVKMQYISKDLLRDNARFTPSESVDVAQAMKLVTHDPPQMLNPPAEAPVLLLFPPSEEELARLSGGMSS